MKLKQLMKEFERSPWITLSEFKQYDESLVLNILDEVKTLDNWGNPLFYKELIDKIISHPDFQDDLMLLDRLNDIKKLLPKCKIPLPYPLNVHIQKQGKSWGLVPHTVFAPTLGQVEQHLRFAEAAVSLRGHKGLIHNEMKKLLEGKKSKHKKVPDKFSIIQLKVSLAKPLIKMVI